jgi:hypothetical protein
LPEINLPRKPSTSSHARASASADVRVAVLATCYNEESAIGKVVRDFKAVLPEATVFVFDNNSTDDTAVGFAIPLAVTYVETGLVPRLPTAILSTGLMILACLSGAIGLVLDTATRGRREMKLLAYLAHRAPGEERRRS